MKITCPSCNTTYNVPRDKIPKRKAVATCNRCRTKFYIEPENVDQSITGVASEPHPPLIVTHSAPVKTDRPSEDSVTETDFAAFMVRNSDKYLSKFRKFQADDIDKFAVTWHWPAFFTGIWWPLYRKLYLWALVVFVVSCIPLLGFLAMIPFAMMGNYIYYKHAKKKIAELKSSHRSSDISVLLSQVGGVNPWVITVVTVLIGIALTGILAAILTPVLLDYSGFIFE